MLCVNKLCVYLGAWTLACREWLKLGSLSTVETASFLSRLYFSELTGFLKMFSTSLPRRSSNGFRARRLFFYFAGKWKWFLMEPKNIFFAELFENLLCLIRSGKLPRMSQIICDWQYRHNHSYICCFQVGLMLIKNFTLIYHCAQARMNSSTFGLRYDLADESYYNI